MCLVDKDMCWCLLTIHGTSLHDVSFCRSWPSARRAHHHATLMSHNSTLFWRGVDAMKTAPNLATIVRKCSLEGSFHIAVHSIRLETVVYGRPNRPLHQRRAFLVSNLARLQSRKVKSIRRLSFPRQPNHTTTHSSLSLLESSTGKLPLDPPPLYLPTPVCPSSV